MIPYKLFRLKNNSYTYSLKYGTLASYRYSSTKLVLLAWLPGGHCSCSPIIDDKDVLKNALEAWIQIKMLPNQPTAIMKIET